MFKNKEINISALRHLYPFQSRYFDRNGLSYHYLNEGCGDPVVMIHGNPTWSFYFRNLIKDLTPGFRVIAVDHIGCGLSAKPDADRYGYRLKNRIDDLEALLEMLDVKRKLTLVVHDWGGMIGLALALRHPDWISRIVITNTAAFMPPGGKRLPFRLRIIRNLKPLAKLAVQGFNIFSIAALHMASCKRLGRDVKKGLKAPYNCWKNRVATLKFVQDIPVDENDPSFSLVKYVDDNLHKLADIPMLICWGERDFVFDLAYFNEWRRRFPQAEAHLFPDAGHYLLEDEPDKVCAIIRDFLQSRSRPLQNAPFCPIAMSGSNFNPRNI